jgi:hypothetical protein
VKFRNVTLDELHVRPLGFSVAPGETTPDLDDDTADGFVGQVDKWVAVGVEGKKHQKEVVTEIETPTTEQENV